MSERERATGSGAPADGRTEVWSYFACVDSEGKPTDTRDVNKSMQATSNFAQHLADRHPDLYNEFKDREVSECD